MMPVIVKFTLNADKKTFEIAYSDVSVTQPSSDLSLDVLWRLPVGIAHLHRQYGLLHCVESLRRRIPR
jgi:hypothetical protein